MMFRQFVTMLRTEYRSRHEGAVPATQRLLWEPWVGAYLETIFPQGNKHEKTVY